MHKGEHKAKAAAQEAQEAAAAKAAAQEAATAKAAWDILTQLESQ